MMTAAEPMSEDLSRQIHDLLECSVCLQQLDATSRVLPCQHTFCRKCLTEIFCFHKELRCPECRILVSCRIDDLPSNILLLRLLEGLKGMQKVDVPLDTPDVSTSSSDLNLSSKADGGATQAKPETTPQKSLYALSLVDQRAKNNSELSLKFGENITILSRENERYYRAAKSNGEVGVVPVSTVRILSPPTSVAPPVPLVKDLPLGKTLYAFQLSVPSSSNCLKFDKGVNIEVLRRVNEQWGEGRLNGKVGHFPLSFVELNPAATALINAKRTTAFTKSGEVISSFISDVPKVHEKRRSLCAIPPSAVVPQPKYETPVGPKPKVPTKPTAAPLGINYTSAHVVAVYNYKGQQPDELDVKKGDVFVVTDRCKDGWFKGYKLDTDRHGVFPGNYFRSVGDAKVLAKPDSGGQPLTNTRKGSVDSNIISSSSRIESANGPQRPQRQRSEIVTNSTRTTAFGSAQPPRMPAVPHSTSSRSASPSSASPSSSSSSSSNRSSADMSDNHFAVGSSPSQQPQLRPNGLTPPVLLPVSLPTSMSQSFSAAGKNVAKNAGNLVRHMFALGINKGSSSARSPSASKSADGSPTLVTDMFEIRTGLSDRPGPSSNGTTFEINPTPIGPPICVNPPSQPIRQTSAVSQDAKRVGQILEVRLRNPIPVASRVENCYSNRDPNTEAPGSSGAGGLGKVFIRNKLRHSLAADTVNGAQRTEQQPSRIKMGLRSVGVGQTRKDRTRSLIVSDSNLINLGNVDTPTSSNSAATDAAVQPSSPSKAKRSNRHSFLGGWKMGKNKKPQQVHENLSFDSFEGFSDLQLRPQLPSPMEPTVAQRPSDQVKMRRKPDQPLPERYRVIVEYPPSSPNELKLEVGEILLVTRKRSDGWFKGTLVSGNSGWFPGVFVEKL